MGLPTIDGELVVPTPVSAYVDRWIHFQVLVFNEYTHNELMFKSRRSFSLLKLDRT